MFAVLIVVAAILVDRLHRYAVQTVVCEHKFRLYALRDDLREAAMGGQVDPTSWVFTYLDSSLGRSINALGRVTLWHVILFGPMASRDGSMAAARAQLSAELRKPTNTLFAKVHDLYGRSLIEFLRNRHRSLLLAVGNALTAISVVEKIGNMLNAAILRLRETPQTSTLYQVAPAMRRTARA